MSVPNIPENLENQNQENQSPSSPEVTDPNAELIAELRRSNANMAEQMNQLRSFVTQTVADLTPVSAPVQDPPVNYSGTELLENPGKVIGDIVERALTPKLNKLQSDIAAQTRPANDMVARTQKEQQLDQLVINMKANGNFPHLNTPYIEQRFKMYIMGSANVDQTVILYSYKSAVGDFIIDNPQPNNPNPNPPMNNNPPRHSPYIAPSNAQPPSGGRIPQLPALDDNEQKIMKQRGYSHARMAFAVGKITREAYLQIEPNAKIPEGFNNRQFAER